MRRNRILYAFGISAFIIILGYALLRELDRNQAQISNSISGVITATPAAGAGIVKDSDPRSEYAEVFAKSAVLKKALKIAGERL